jgi:hypothetical protein
MVTLPADLAAEAMRPSRALPTSGSCRPASAPGGAAAGSSAGPESMTHNLDGNVFFVLDVLVFASPRTATCK